MVLVEILVGILALMEHVGMVLVEILVGILAVMEHVGMVLVGILAVMEHVGMVLVEIDKHFGVLQVVGIDWLDVGSKMYGICVGYRMSLDELEEQDGETVQTVDAVMEHAGMVDVQMEDVVMEHAPMVDAQTVGVQMEHVVMEPVGMVAAPMADVRMERVKIVGGLVVMEHVGMVQSNVEMEQLAVIILQDGQDVRNGVDHEQILLRKQSVLAAM